MSNLNQDISGFAFTAQPLDRADALRDDHAAVARLWPDARVLVLDDDGAALADADGAPIELTGAALGGGPGTAIFLGIAADGPAWFCINASAVAVQAPRRIGLREAAAVWSDDLSSLFAYARGMSYWQARTRYCGVCGGQIEFQRAGFVGHCPDCGNNHFPRVDPAVIVAVSDGTQLLLGRQPSWPERRYSVIAGFVEPGEAPEQTVVREVHEETRVKVDSCRFLGAQPWPFPGALMLGFRASAAPGQQPQVDGELADARWVSREQIGQALLAEETGCESELMLPPRISIARALIEHWYRSGR